MYFRIVDGEIRRGDKIKFMANGVEREVGELRILCAIIRVGSGAQQKSV